SQPLYTRKSKDGLLNQVGLLRKAGAVYMQVMMLTPSPGSKLYVESYTSGLAYERAGSAPVEPHFVDGNHVVASRHPRPWARQLNLLAAYLYFYNPLRFLVALVRPKTRIPFAGGEVTTANSGGQDAPRGTLRHRALRKVKVHLGDASMQMLGMTGLLPTIRRTLGWALRLMGGRIKRHNTVPASSIPMRSVDGSPASHAVPGTPTRQHASLDPKDRALVASARD
ncbi:hypothetical protein LCGC14_1847830, partial [marine sediment metagenome]